MVEEEQKVQLSTDNALDYASDPTTNPWTESLFECLLQVSEGLNVTVDIIYNLQNLANSSLNQLSDRELYLYLLNSSVWGEVNSTFWDTSGGTRLTACLVPSPVDRPYLLPWWQQLTWTLAFGSMLLVAVGGNAIVMWIVIAHRRMRTVTNYFLVNLSGADLLMSVFNCMFNFIYMLHSDWPFGSVYCTISNFMANVTIAASVFTLMAISFDRYIAIVRPLKPRMSKSEARHVIIIIWLSSMTLAVPCLLYSTTLSIRYKNDEIRRGCILLWPDGETSFSYREYV
ncbi:tachykinin-like peptides receptor 86C [Panulirus ornatus]|uniref:tachykinin-like peptides receptor 86C n=1 Tax=Panulirus ornatus TaxID=150431 RepID=UPI003A8B81E9